jgi:hypothetical protein
VTTRIPALVAALAVLGGALTACASGPNQVNSAVIIGDRVISVDDVQRRLDETLKVEPAAKDLAKNHKLDLVSRGIVDQLVRHELLAEAARRDGLTVSEKDLADLTAGTAPAQDPVQRSVEAAFDPKEIAKDRLLTVSLGQKNLDKVQLTLDGVAMQTPGFTKQKAIDLAKQMAAQPDKAAALGQAAGAGAGGQQGPQPLSAFPWNAIRVYAGAAQQASQSGQAPPVEALLPPIFAAPSNSVIVLSLGSGENAASAGYLVALVKRANGGVPSQDATFANQVPADWRFALGEHLLGPLVKELGLRVSPRYGVWDDLAVGLAPSDAEKVGVLLPAGNARP